MQKPEPVKINCTLKPKLCPRKNSLSIPETLGVIVHDVQVHNYLTLKYQPEFTNIFTF